MRMEIWVPPNDFNSSMAKLFHMNWQHRYILLDRIISFLEAGNGRRQALFQIIFGNDHIYTNDPPISLVDIPEIISSLHSLTDCLESPQRMIELEVGWPQKQPYEIIELILF